MAKAAQTTAFPNDQTVIIERAIELLCKRVKCTINKPVVSYRDMLNLIAPPQHIEVLMNARAVCNLGRYVGSESGNIQLDEYRRRKIFVEFDVGNRFDAPVMPKNQVWRADEPHNVMLATALMSCAREHADVAIEWGYVKSAFTYLNGACIKRPDQLRYLWPSILGIMSIMPGLEETRSKLTPMTVPRGLPTLPQKVRQLLRHTSATVAMALLLPQLEQEDPPAQDVKINFCTDPDALKIDEGVFTYAIN